MRLVPARLQIHVPPARLLGFVASNEPLVPPWPRLIISIGRRSVPIALALKDVAKAYALHIQNPKVPKHRFDLIAAPIHDGYTGDNVVNTFGAVHSVTAERLAGAAQSFAGQDRAAAPPAHRRAARRREPGLLLSAGACRNVRRDAGASRARQRRIAARYPVATNLAGGVARPCGDHRRRSAFPLGRQRRESLLRLPRQRRRHRRDGRLRQHGHRGGRHRQAGLCPAIEGQVAATRASSTN